MSRAARMFPNALAAAATGLRIGRLYTSARSPRAVGRLLVHGARRALNRRVPLWMTLAPTFRCQCRCIHCYAEGRPVDSTGEMTTDEVRDVLDQAAALGVLQAAFSGGDPLLRDDLEDLIAHTRSLGMLSRLRTNALGLDAARVRSLKEAGLTVCGISIDHPDPAEHDRRRGVKECFDAAVNALRLMREAGVLCEVLTYASRDNITEGLERIFALSREEGAFSVFVFFPIASGRMEDSFDQMLAPDEMARVRALHDLNFVHLEIPAPGARCCVFKRSLVYVNPYGQVTPCPFVPDVIGDLKQEGLATVWERHCRALKVDYAGDCFLNDPDVRAEFSVHCESVRSGAGGRES